MSIITIYVHICEHDSLACSLYNESNYILYLALCIEMNFLSCLLSLLPSKFIVNTVTDKD